MWDFNRLLRNFFSCRFKPVNLMACLAKFTIIVILRSIICNEAILVILSSLAFVIILFPGVFFQQRFLQHIGNQIKFLLCILSSLFSDQLFFFLSQPCFNFLHNANSLLLLLQRRYFLSLSFLRNTHFSLSLLIEFDVLIGRLDGCAQLLL